jgi:hypothetical protein
MRLVHVPPTPEHVAAAEGLWLPFMDGIAAGSRTPKEALVAQARRGDVQLHLVWDDEAGKALALVGTYLDPEQRAMMIRWCTGRHRRRWIHLIADLAAHAKAQGCTALKPVARLGWRRDLEALGFRATHICMEKELT